MRYIKLLHIVVFLGGMFGYIEASPAGPIPKTTIQQVPDNNTIVGTTGPGKFVDYWTFQLGSTNNAVGTVTNNIFQITTSEWTVTFQNIVNLNISLYSAALGSSVDSPLTFSSVALPDSDPSDTVASSDNLIAGYYALKISGEGIGSTGGKYSATIAVTPVPEPETWAMLLIGMVLLGMQLRRKNISQNPMVFSA